MEISAIVDTGSDISCVRYDSFMMMPEVDLICEKKMIGIGEKEIETIGAFETDVDLDGVRVPVKFHVAHERDILYSAVLGNNIFEYVNVLIDAEGAKFSSKSSTPEVQSKIVQDTDSATEKYNEVIRELGEICIAAEDFEFDVGHLKRDVQDDILKMIGDYNPIKPKTFPVKIKIILKDEIPMAERWHSET